MTTEREQILALARPCGLNTAPIEQFVEAFYHAARKPLEEEIERLKVAADKYNKLLHITERGCYQLLYWDTDMDEWQKVSVEEGVNHGS